MPSLLRNNILYDPSNIKMFTDWQQHMDTMGLGCKARKSFCFLCFFLSSFFLWTHPNGTQFYRKGCLSPVRAGSSDRAVGGSHWLTCLLLSFQFHIHLQSQGESKCIWHCSVLPVCGEFPGDLHRLICNGVCVCCCHSTDILCVCRVASVHGIFLIMKNLQGGEPRHSGSNVIHIVKAILIPSDSRRQRSVPSIDRIRFFCYVLVLSKSILALLVISDLRIWTALK